MKSVTANDQRQFKYAAGDSTTMAEFEKLYADLFNRTWEVQGKKFNLKELGWKRTYNNANRSLGSITASRYSRDKRLVKISKALLSRNLDKAYDFEDTIRHEIAHAIDVEIRNKSNHDWHWKTIARALGANDDRLHEGFLEKKQGKYTAVCTGCGMEHQKYRKPKRKSWCKCRNRTFKPEEALDFIQNY